ncbi:MAG: helix-turn-helix transcriptional regulator [Alphaproteobacteria bacterium]|nr:helix-turn-helix transcriptional regulator [Alphaproteobacteria bacterium]
MSAQTLRVLGSLLSDPRDELSGADLARLTTLPSGTLYPILLRLEGAKWLSSRWEKDDPSELGRPRRRFYRLTALGAKRAKQELRVLQPMIGGIAWT